jgi:hypothetical protein
MKCCNSFKKKTCISLSRKHVPISHNRCPSCRAAFLRRRLLLSRSARLFLTAAGCTFSKTKFSSPRPESICAAGSPASYLVPQHNDCGHALGQLCDEGCMRVGTGSQDPPAILPRHPQGVRHVVAAVHIHSLHRTRARLAHHSPGRNDSNRQ